MRASSCRRWSFSNATLSGSSARCAIVEVLAARARRGARATSSNDRRPAGLAISSGPAIALPRSSAGNSARASCEGSAARAQLGAAAAQPALDVLRVAALDLAARRARSIGALASHAAHATVVSRIGSRSSAPHEHEVERQHRAQQRRDAPQQLFELHVLRDLAPELRLEAGRDRGLVADDVHGFIAS